MPVCFRAKKPSNRLVLTFTWGVIFHETRSFVTTKFWQATFPNFQLNTKQGNFLAVTFPLTWENRLYFLVPLLVSPKNKVWGMNAKMPHWWRSATMLNSWVCNKTLLLSGATELVSIGNILFYCCHQARETLVFWLTVCFGQFQIGMFDCKFACTLSIPWQIEFFFIIVITIS